MIIPISIGAGIVTLGFFAWKKWQINQEYLRKKHSIEAKAEPRNRKLFSDGEPRKFIPGPVEVAAIGYMNTFIWLATESKLFELSIFKSELAKEPYEVMGFLSGFEGGAKGFSAGNKLGGPVGGVIGAVVGVLASIVSGIFKVNHEEEEQRLLRRFFVKTTQALGPPPTGLFHFFEYCGFPSFDVVPTRGDLDKDVGLWIWFLNCWLKAREDGWPVDQIPCISREELDRQVRAGEINRIPSEWRELSPPSRLGPWYAYAFHPYFLLGRMRHRDSYGEQFYDAYKKVAATRNPVDAFRFNKYHLSLLKERMEKSAKGLKPDETVNSVQMEIGHDPFWVSEDARLKAGYLVNFPVSLNLDSRLLSKR